MNARHTLEKVLPVVESLSSEEKVELAQRLLGSQSGLSVVVENNFLQWMVKQIDWMNRDELSEILNAVSYRLSTKGQSLQDRDLQANL
ncbi:hypothetical protein [Chroococcidiopsis sp. TS-821]|uniref:hypothetical protein n=1 Tax=Chroococcidiopsis sp. TS-821 TaxID=1378066 RepID=UPI000CEEADD5|nr:hypothetical protein [Chroococcidiopsis sp. TS-821]PPS41935.1 hypothetical protein B1A85_15765 [Chroococcidiopsis sp. TS-821]